MREDEVRNAMLDMDGNSFELFVRELLRRSTFPALLPTSASHDLGEDAFTAPSQVFEHHGLRISLATSKTATLAKIEKDCDRAAETGRAIHVLVFATTTGPDGSEPDTATTDKWRAQVKAKYGWDLEVRTLRALVPIACGPENEDLVDQYLRVPPLGEDFFWHIQGEFQFHTERAVKAIQGRLPEFMAPLPRAELVDIATQFELGRNIIIVGAAGTGKSWLGAKLAIEAREMGKTVLFIDARRLGGVKNETELRQHFDLKGSLRAAIKRAGRNTKCRVVVDQLDNISGSVAAQLLVDTAADCTGTGRGVEWVCICRNETPNERQILGPLLVS